MGLHESRPQNRTPKLAAAAFAALAGLAPGLAIAAMGDEQAKGPKLRQITCLTECSADGAASIGSSIELAGKRLEAVKKVKFSAVDGGRVGAKPDGVSYDAVEVTVPEEATSGEVRVIDTSRQKAISPVELEIADAPSEGNPGQPDPTDPPSDPGTGEITIDPDKGFFAGRRQISVQISSRQDISGSSAEVVSASSGEVVATLPIEAGATSLTWDGKTDDGEAAENGEYELRIGSASAPFEQYNHMFPVRGKHTFGDGLGAGRDHQGQDILAECGKRIRAARAGKVTTVGFDGGGGNYVVIDGKKTDVSYVYMHLQDSPEVSEGERVKTGEKLGRVGDTGNASTCHLHFEMWHGAQGGELKDPSPPLKEWDEWS